MSEAAEAKARLLVVDDDSSHRAMLEAVLREEGYAVTSAAGGDEALAALEGDTCALVLLDIRMAGKSGLEVLEEIRRRLPGLPVVMMTAYASVETAVEALKIGARDYLSKPLDTTELKLTIARVLEHSRLETENRELRARLKEEFSFGRLVGASAAMANVIEILRRVAPTDATLLILGESGTGKELVANAVHENSPRSRAPFVAVNCAAIPETLLESELFGYEKGAFTGAVGRREGKIASAHGGTLFLDEVAEMTAALQAKMLRFLQEREIQPQQGGRCPHPRRHEPRLGGRGQGEKVPGGSLLSVERGAGADPPAPQAEGGHRPPRRALLSRLSREASRVREKHLPGGPGGPGGAPLAREREGA
jgi:two-component system response regulator HydG